jgi:hypothetical protein
VKKLMTSIDMVVFAQILVAAANIVMAFVMYLSIKEIRKDRRRVYLEKKLEEFYIPLINLFSHGNLKRDAQDHDKVEEIIVSRRHLCGKKLAKILPQHFTAMLGPGNFYFEFASEEELRRWIGVADAIWEEYIEVLREYYEIIGVRHYTLPEKPKWMFGLGITPRVF